MQMYTTTMTQPDPERFMDQYTSWEVSSEGQQVAGPQHLALDATTSTTRPSAPAEAELDPAKRAALFIKMNDLVGQRRTS